MTDLGFYKKGRRSRRLDVSSFSVMQMDEGTPPVLLFMRTVEGESTDRLLDQSDTLLSTHQELVEQSQFISSNNAANQMTTTPHVMTEIDSTCQTISTQALANHAASAQALANETLTMEISTNHLPLPEHKPGTLTILNPPMDVEPFIHEDLIAQLEAVGQEEIVDETEVSASGEKTLTLEIEGKSAHLRKLQVRMYLSHTFCIYSRATG